MRNGMRFTCLERGDSLLGQTWEYKNLTGVEAIEKKLEDMFYQANKLNVTEIIDKICIGKDSSGTLFLPNTGINGNVWPLQRRISLYAKHIAQYKLNMLIEVEFPTIVNSLNYLSYAKFVAELIDRNTWCQYWQIMTIPERANGLEEQPKCPPDIYVQIMHYLYITVKQKHPHIKIGGPGVLYAIKEYIQSSYKNEQGETFHKGWLAEATGELFGTDTKYDLTEKAGFLPYIDFFAFQGDTTTGQFPEDDYCNIIKKLKHDVNHQAQRNGFNLNVEWLSTKQGHSAEPTNNLDLQLQAYRDLKEYINNWRVDVISYKKQLVDEYYDTKTLNISPDYFGIMHYYMTGKQKPAYIQFYFILKKLANFHLVNRDKLMVKSHTPYQPTTEVDSIMFISDQHDKILTIIYPTTERLVNNSEEYYTTITLRGAVGRKVYTPDGTEVVVVNPLDVNFKHFDFIIVEESLTDNGADNHNLQQELFWRMFFWQNTTKDLLSMVPDDYNKEVYDTNFYKLIRSLGMNYGDAAYEKKILEDNMYLATVHGVETMYNNFGVMTSIKWKPGWDEERYRQIISGVIDSLLHGATKNSITMAIKAYTGYEVKIYEMFTDYKHYGLPQELNWNNQYRFTIEVEKELGDTTDIATIYKDVKYITDIVKPAHTLPIIMVVLVGKENYKQWYKERYGKDFKDSDIFEIEQTDYENSNIFGWKTGCFPFVFHTANDKLPTKLNSAFPLAPKYSLYDKSYFDIEFDYIEQYDKAKEEGLIEINPSFEEIVPKTIVDVDKENLNILCTEAQFGIKPSKIKGLLKTNGGLHYDKQGNIIYSEHKKLNSFCTGFAYTLKDNSCLELELIYSDKFHKVKNEYSVEFTQYLEELYKGVHEEPLIEFNLPMQENRVGSVVYYKHNCMTYSDHPAIANRKNRLTNQSRAGVKYRVNDYVINEINYSNTEKISKPAESCTMRLYTVSKKGKIHVLEERS